MVNFSPLFVLLVLILAPFSIHAGQKDLPQQLVKFELVAQKIADAINNTLGIEFNVV